MIKRPTKPSEVPPSLPILPLSGAFLFPSTHRPLNIFETNYLYLVDHILGSNRLVGLTQPTLDQPKIKLKQTKNKTKNKLGNIALETIGTIGKLVHFEEVDQKRYLIVLEGITRFKLGTEIKSDLPFLQYKVDSTAFAFDFSDLADNQEQHKNDKTYFDRDNFIAIMRSYAEFADLDINWKEVEGLSNVELINLTCMLGPYSDKEKQSLLEASSLTIRAQTLIALAELEMNKAQFGAGLQ